MFGSGNFSTTKVYSPTILVLRREWWCQISRKKTLHHTRHCVFVSGRTTGRHTWSTSVWSHRLIHRLTTSDCRCEQPTTDAPAAITLGLEAVESLLAASDQPWLCWRSLNRLRTGICRAKTTMRRWGNIDNQQAVSQL